MRFALSKPQNQSALDCALEGCLSTHVQLLVDAGADIQVSFRKYVHRKLNVPLWAIAYDRDMVNKLQVLVDNGATTGDEELALLGKVSESCSGSVRYRRAHEFLLAVTDILTSAQPKVLNVYIEETSSDSWAVAIHSLGGGLIATLSDVSPSLTVGEIQKEIKSQALIPLGRQSLVLDNEKIDPNVCRSTPLREVRAR
jgi:hypothetical protein